MKVTPFPLDPVLIVDDEPEAVRGCSLALRSGGINNVLECLDSREVLPLLAGRKVELILLDLTMPYLSGEKLLAMVREEHPDVPVIIITAANDVGVAVQCMRDGAVDYMVKPVEWNRLVSGVRRAIELRQLRRESIQFKQRVFEDALDHPEAFSEFVTVSKKVRAAFQYVEAMAGSASPVLITGETGVGKELMARAVHALSGREGAFVPVNMAGVDDTLFSDTLFGHQKGAFTGAEQTRGGMVEQAAEGSLFLDEIGEMPLVSQGRLLRLLQEREYFPLGSDIPKRSRARIIVATHQDLDALQAEGRFRKDLYFRLRTHHVHIPPLRERKEDLPVLVDHFLDKAAQELGKKKPTPPGELRALLATYHFPGNVRELEAMVYDAVSNHTKPGPLSMALFRAHLEGLELGTMNGVPAPRETADGRMFGAWQKLPTLKEACDALIKEALDRADGNQTIAARLIGMTRAALNKRLTRQGE